MREDPRDDGRPFTGAPNGVWETFLFHWSSFRRCITEGIDGGLSKGYTKYDVVSIL